MFAAAWLGVFAAALAAAQSSGPPADRDGARRWLLAAGRLPEPAGLMQVLSTGLPELPDLVRAYLAGGVDASREVTFAGEDGQPRTTAPLNHLMEFGCDDAATTRVVDLLVKAGANPSRKSLQRDGVTPAMEAVRCPDALQVMLAASPDLNVVDNRGWTVMHHAVNALIEPADEATARLVAAAGFDMARWTPALLKEFGANRDRRRLVEALAAASASAPAPAPAAPPVTEPAASEWKRPGPYPSRPRATAAQLLARPGAVTTIDDHFWDSITRREPYRLALALQAGANAKQTRSGTGYTPLLLLAERCGRDDDVERTSIAEQLVAAGADLTGVDSNQANSLVLAAGVCPLGVVRALINAGMPLGAVSATGATALRNAIEADRPDIVTALLDAGLDPRTEPYNAGRLASGKREVTAALKRKR